MASTQDQLLTYMNRLVAESGQNAIVTADTDLMASGLLDSINLVGLIGFVEQTFGIEISDDDMGPDLFESPQSLARFIEARQTEAA